MKGKRILRLVLLAAVAAVMFSLLNVGKKGAFEVQAASEPANAAKILRTTVQIELVSEGWVEGNVKQRLGAQGLGTLVQVGERRYIVTHDHWSLADHALSHVVLRDADGVELQVLDGATFLSLVRYRDGGTMILLAPSQLPGVVPATLYDGAGPAGEDTVWLPARSGSGNGLQLSDARVQAVFAATVPGTLQLRGAPNAVTAGDSGAGVWFDGQLIANLWAVTEVRTVSDSLPWPWDRLLGGAKRWQRTGVMLAGLQPLHGVSGLTAGDLAPDIWQEDGYERGPLQ